VVYFHYKIPINKMDEKELLKERFKSAVSSAVKVISEQFDLEVKFGNNINPKKDLLYLPEVANLRNLQDFTNLRAFADSEALKIKYTDKKIYLENEPKGTMAKMLYAIAEKIRYEKVGSDKLKGVKNNITQCYENKFKNKKIEVIWDSVVVEIIGEKNPKNVTGIKIKNLKTNSVSDLKIDGLFIAIGHDPATSLFKGQLDMDKDGYIITKPDSTATKIPGVYAAGDVKDKIFRQAVTAAGMGCMSALEAEKFLSEKFS